MTADLVAFLRQQLDEDEQAARAAIEPSEMHPYGDEKIPLITPEQVPDQVRGYLGGTWGEHFARHAPARVLADVQAKRAILALHEPWRGKQEGTRVYCSTCVGYPIDTNGIIGMDWPCPTLRLLASVFADHPDFDPAWRIDTAGHV